MANIFGINWLIYIRKQFRKFSLLAVWKLNTLGVNYLSVDYTATAARWKFMVIITQTSRCVINKAFENVQFYSCTTKQRDRHSSIFKLVVTQQFISFNYLRLHKQKIVSLSIQWSRVYVRGYFAGKVLQLIYSTELNQSCFVCIIKM